MSTNHDARTVWPGFAVAYHNAPPTRGRCGGVRLVFDSAVREPSEPNPFESITRALIEQAAALDVAWDRLHATGWQPEQVELRRQVEDPGLVQLAVRNGGPVLFETRIDIVVSPR